MASWTCWIGSSSGIWARPRRPRRPRRRRWRRRRRPVRRSSIGGSSGAPGRGGVGQSGDGVGGGGDHAVGDPGGPGDGDAEPEAGEDQRVVGLGDAVGDPVERRPGANGLPVATRARPSVQARRSAGSASALRGRVGQRHDDRPVGVRGHVPDDGLGERAGLGGGADQHGRVDLGDDLGEADPRRPSAAQPATSAAGSGVGQLEVAQARVVVDEQAPAAQRPRTAGSPPRGTALRGS